jgi:pyrimidine operon attenuation protein/uracil phosphoribosyltransferase
LADEREILSADDIRQALVRMAHEIVERNQGAHALMLVGLQRRGVPLAHRIADAIADFEQVEVPVGALDINLYRDDLTSRPQPLVRPTTLPAGLDGTRVVLVDGCALHWPQHPRRDGRTHGPRTP